MEALWQGVEVGVGWLVVLEVVVVTRAPGGALIIFSHGGSFWKLDDESHKVDEPYCITINLNF
jgi:hypothetical protein